MDVDKSGVLWKRARGNSFRSLWGLIRTWDQRWFVLEDGRLRYYKSDKPPDASTELKGTLLVYGCRSQRVSLDGMFDFRSHTFEIQGCKESDDAQAETLIVAARSEKEMNEWMAALGKTVNDTAFKAAKNHGRHQQKHHKHPQKQQQQQNQQQQQRSHVGNKAGHDHHSSHGAGQSTTRSKGARRKGNQNSNNKPEAKTANSASDSKAGHGGGGKEAKREDPSNDGEQGSKDDSASKHDARGKFEEGAEQGGRAKRLDVSLEGTDWVEQKGEGGAAPRYRDTQTGEVVKSIDMVILREWAEFDNDAKPYFHNRVTQETTWTRPEGIDEHRARRLGRTQVKLHNLNEKKRQERHEHDMHTFYMEQAESRVAKWEVENPTLLSCLLNLHQIVDIGNNSGGGGGSAFGLSDDSELSDIKKALRRALAAVHPDKAAGDDSPAMRAQKQLVFNILNERREEADFN